MNIRFDGKVAIVTGGTGGIGEACAKLLLESGAKVTLADVDRNRLNSVVEKLSVFGEIKGYVMNVAKVQDIEKSVEQIIDEMGEVSILIQTAGILANVPGIQITEQQWNQMIDVNAKGLFFVMQKVVEKTMKSNAGSIVNFCSMAGIRGMRPEMAGAHYSASKGAVKALTMQAAVEWAAYGIRVNAVAPGGVMTEKMLAMKFPENAFDAVPLKRLSTPEEIANTVVFLASDKAAMITGQTLVIDGGSSIVGN